MFKENINNILQKLESYETRSFEDSVKERLDLVTKRYIEDLSRSYLKIVNSKATTKTIVKELSK